MAKIEHKYKLYSGKTEKFLDIISNKKKLREYLTKLSKYHTETFFHTLRVGLLALDLGIENNLSEEKLILLTYGALLHDIGKLDIPKNLLDKKGKLSSLEISILREHPNIGAGKIYGFDKSVNKLILSHHEYQINPYPRKKIERRKDRQEDYEMRKNKEEIKELLQILTVADWYDALRNKRSYKLPKSKKETNLILKAEYTGDKKYIQQVLKR